jgi:hypothetical protein
MLSWGSLPMNYVETWRSRRCDLVFTSERMSARPLSTCPNLNAAAEPEKGTRVNVQQRGHDYVQLLCILHVSPSQTPFPFFFMPPP